MSKILPYNNHNDDDDDDVGKIRPHLNKSKANDKIVNFQSSSTSTTKSKIKIRNRSVKNQPKHRIQRPCRAQAAAAATVTTTTTTAKEGRKGSSFRNFKPNRSFKAKDDENRKENMNNGNGKKGKTNHHFRIPLRSRSMFIKIRQKGRNFGIRCKTSVDLWRKWIKRGIGLGDHHHHHDVLVSGSSMLNETMVCF